MLPIPLQLRYMLGRANKHYEKREEFPDIIKQAIIDKSNGMCAGNVPSYKCQKMGVYLNPHLRAIDHIIPCRSGGLPMFYNGQVLCLDCHAEKSLRENRIFPKKNSKRKFDQKLAETWIACMFGHKLVLRFKKK